MQVLWCEALEGNCPITVDEFLYCYKPSEIKRSASFYQFSSRGSYYSLIKGRSSSDRLQKTEFFIISGNWVRDPVDVHSAPFPPFTSPIGHLRPEGMFPFQFTSFLFNFQFSVISPIFLLLQLLFVHAWKSFIQIGLTKYIPSLGEPFTIWLLLVVQQFGGLVHYLLQKTLVTRKPLVEVSIVHSSFSFCIIVFVLLFSFYFFFNLIFLVAGIITMRENKE